jgi:hypothetical protein
MIAHEWARLDQWLRQDLVFYGCQAFLSTDYASCVPNVLTLIRSIRSKNPLTADSDLALSRAATAPML